MHLRLLSLVLFVFLYAGGSRADEGFAPSPDDVNPLLIGHQLPNVVLTDVDNASFDLITRNKEKPLVVVFYRGYW